MISNNKTKVIQKMCIIRIIFILFLSNKYTYSNIFYSNIDR